MTSYKRCVLCKKFSNEISVATVTWTTPVFRCAPNIPLAKSKEVDICETCIDTLFKLNKHE